MQLTIQITAYVPDNTDLDAVKAHVKRAIYAAAAPNPPIAVIHDRDIHIEATL